MTFASKKQPLKYEFIVQQIEQCKDSRAAALIAFTYILGARIGEVLPYQHRALSPETIKANKENRKLKAQGKPVQEVKQEWQAYSTQGLLKENIRDTPTQLEITIPNFKNKGQTWKAIGIPKDSEKAITEVIQHWLQVCPSNQLFNMRRTTAFNLIKKNLGYSPHYLRHSRATHYAQIFKFNAFDIMESLGHADIATSAIYVKSNLADRMQKIRESGV